MPYIEVTEQEAHRRAVELHAEQTEAELLRAREAHDEALLYAAAALLRRAWPGAARIALELPDRDRCSPNALIVYHGDGTEIIHATQLGALIAELDDEEAERDAIGAVSVLIRLHASVPLRIREPDRGAGGNTVGAWPVTSARVDDEEPGWHVEFALPSPGLLPPGLARRRTGGH